MDKINILNYIKYPGNIKSADLGQLKEIVKAYPFYQSAHVLLLKYLKDNDKINELEVQLSKSSIHISDRDLLFRFLNTEYSPANKVEKIEDRIKTEDEIVENNLDSDLSEKVEINESESEDIKKETNYLKNKNVKRKINNSLDGMGENISETISSQLEFAVLKEKDKLEYPSEIYFIEEERSGKNNVITIDADPEDIKKIRKKKDILQIDESIKKEPARNEGSESLDKEKDDDVFELIETEDIEKKKENKAKKNEYFDINHYADESELNNGNDLITQFIEKNPRIKAKEVDEEIKDISEKSVEEDKNLLSETLIKVYIKQGLFEKAIESYRKLILKYPEKNAYFASQIKILEDKINK